MIFDIIICIILLLGFYAGYQNGLFGIFLKITLFILSILLSLYLFPFVFLFLENSFSEINIIFFILGFFIVFALILLLNKVISKKIELMLSKKSKHFLPKLIGGIISSFFILTISSFIFLGTLKLKILKLEKIQPSIFSLTLLFVANSVKEIAWDFNQNFNQNINNNLNIINDAEEGKKR